MDFLIALLVLILYIGLICLIGFGALQILASLGTPIPASIVLIIRLLIAVVCIVIVIEFLTGGLHWPGLTYHRGF